MKSLFGFALKIEKKLNDVYVEEEEILNEWRRKRGLNKFFTHQYLYNSE